MSRPAKPRSPTHAWSNRLFLLFVGTLAACLTAELAVRYFDLPPRPLVQVPFRTYQLSADPVIGYEYRPGYNPEQTPFDRDHAGFAINQAGFRDIDRPIAKPPRTFRILVLGDSTTAGNGIPDAARLYVSILQEQLNSAAEDGKRYEVFNMGVGGYHTVQEVRTLETKGLVYDPDLVVLVVCLNDFFPDSDGNVHRFLMTVNAPSEEVLSGALRTLLGTSRLAFILYHVYFASDADDDYRKWYRDNVLRGRDPVQAGMSMLREFEARHPLPAMVVILPEFRVPFSHYTSHDLHRRAREAAQGIDDVTVLDAMSGFAAIDDNASKFSYDSMHLNEHGHRVMADILFEALAIEIRREQDSARSPGH